MKRPTDKQLAEMTLEDASNYLECAVYEAVIIIERLDPVREKYPETKKL